LVFFLCFGLIGVNGFFYIYIYAITLNGIGVAAVLLYTAPIWVTLYSVFFFHERIELRLSIALLLAVAGVALVSQIYSQSAKILTLVGILAGLGAGIGYASYILFNKSALQRDYQLWTVNAYALGIGALLMIPLQPWGELTRPFAEPNALVWLLILGIVPTLGGSLAFNLGLQRIPASNASIVVTLEPLIAILRDVYSLLSSWIPCKSWEESALFSL
jgi:drug/metabolite transporter (DMT)-like permease